MPSGWMLDWVMVLSERNLSVDTKCCPERVKSRWKPLIFMYRFVISFADALHSTFFVEPVDVFLQSSHTKVPRGLRSAPTRVFACILCMIKIFDAAEFIGDAYFCNRCNFSLAFLVGERSESISQRWSLFESLETF